MIRGMFLEEFSLGGEVAKGIIQYLVPIVLAFGLIVFTGLLQFVWQRVVMTWRGIAIVAVSIITLVFQPAAALWVVGLSLFLFSWVEFKAFREGPRTQNPCVVFTGFFCLAPGKDKLRTNANTAHLSSKFLAILESLIASHGIQKVIPIEAVDYKIPRIIYAFDDAESFRNKDGKVCAAES
jgi:hypothetical protein